MAMVRWALVALVAVAAAATWIAYARTAGERPGVAGVEYVCPMHPQVVADHPGECPICGMDLVQAPSRTASGSPPAPAAHAAAGPQRYTCPMHPEFVTDDPGVRCPKCHMKLVAVAPAEAMPSGLASIELAPDRVQLIGMKTALVVREPLTPTIRAVGFVTVSETGLVSVNARFGGWIEDLTVGETGRLVQKGAVLASLYSPEAQNAQQIFLNSARWTGQAASPGIARPAGDVERDARLRLELMGMDPRDIDALAASGVPARGLAIRSPVRGYVARKSAVRGLFVPAGGELFQIADLSTVWVIIDVYESDIPRIRVGQQASFESRANPGRKLSGRVGFIYPALNTGSRTLQARVELRNPSLELRPGMYGDVTLDLGAAQALVIPTDALIDTGEQQYVFVDRGAGRFEPRLVRAGWSGNGKTAVLEGLAAGERVVTTANFLLDSESRMRAAVEGFGQAARAPEPDMGMPDEEMPAAMKMQDTKPPATKMPHAKMPGMTMPDMKMAVEQPGNP
jgi:multidrug efflux pump subunit AcrA (membrane-fusion protein)